MRVQQVNERVKEAPAHALRALFAGVGQMLSVADKLRGKTAAPPEKADAPESTAESTAESTVETAATKETAPETAQTPAATAETVVAEESDVTVIPATAESADPEPAAAKPAKPKAAPKPRAAAAAPAAPAAEAGATEPPAPEATVAEATVAEAAAPAADLPLANYDDLTIASLRARLRNLSADQLAQLIDYEKGHAARADVIAMFERRIAKLAEG